MNSDKVKIFMTLAGQTIPTNPSEASDQLRKLGAQLVLSETLEYVMKGLGIKLKINGQVIDHPDSLEYVVSQPADKEEMLDGLADVAYTMYWNALAFGLSIEEAYQLVCENNLEKFVRLANWSSGERKLEQTEWGLNKAVVWPTEVKSVEVIKVGSEYYAVGKDQNGKVRKPSTYQPVDLSSLL